MQRKHAGKYSATAVTQLTGATKFVDQLVHECNRFTAVVRALGPTLPYSQHLRGISNRLPFYSAGSLLQAIESSQVGNIKELMAHSAPIANLGLIKILEEASTIDQEVEVKVLGIVNCKEATQFKKAFKCWESYTAKALWSVSDTLRKKVPASSKLLEESGKAYADFTQGPEYIAMKREYACFSVIQSKFRPLKEGEVRQNLLDQAKCCVDALAKANDTSDAADADSLLPPKVQLLLLDGTAA